MPRIVLGEIIEELFVDLCLNGFEEICLPFIREFIALSFHLSIRGAEKGAFHCIDRVSYPLEVLRWNSRAAKFRSSSSSGYGFTNTTLTSLKVSAILTDMKKTCPRGMTDGTSR
jgi:hypothetical protein